MNKVHALTAENLLAALPQALRKDESIYALATAAAQALAERPAEIDGIRIYSRIDELTEELLDILAYDFKVDWWDYGYSVEQKRQTLKDSWLVHKHLGTKFAVKTAISAIYPNSDVEEWFEWGGEPYTFRLLIDVSGVLVDQNRHSRVLELANYYKNLRSHLCGIEYTVEAKEPATFRMGGQLACVVKLCIPEIADTFHFTGALRAGVTGAVTVTVPLPEIPSQQGGN